MERPSSTESMLSDIPTMTLPPVDLLKQRCPTDSSTVFYYLETGISYKCRHCKQTQIVTWDEVLRKYQEVHKEQSA